MPYIAQIYKIAIPMGEPVKALAALCNSTGKGPKPILSDLMVCLSKCFQKRTCPFSCISKMSYSKITKEKKKTSLKKKRKRRLSLHVRFTNTIQYSRLLKGLFSINSYLALKPESKSAPSVLKMSLRVWASSSVTRGPGILFPQK